MKTYKRAALICRVSSDQQDFQRQTHDLRELVTQMGYTIESDDDVYAEKISGTLKADDRPEMVRLKKNVSTGVKKYDMVFAQEVSRIGRNPGDAKNTIEFLADYGVPVYVQNLNMTSINPDGSRNVVFHIVYTVYAETAKTENDLRVLRSKSGTLHKVRHGHAGAGVLKAYGYTKDKNKMLVIHPQEAEVVKDIYRMVLEGMGGKQICHVLNTRGIPTKTQTVLKKKGKLKMKGTDIYKNIEDIKWVDGSINDILTNPIYKGLRRYKGELIPLPHLQLIDEETWEKVQVIRKQRFDSRVRDTRWLYMLQGMLRCGTCGRNMYGRYKAGGKDCYYQCSSVRDKGCGNGGINIEVLESCIWQMLRDDPSVYQYFQNRETELGRANNDINRVKVDLAMNEAKLIDLDDQIARLNHMYELGKIQEPYWLDRTAKVEGEIKLVQLSSQDLMKRLISLGGIQKRLTNMDDYTALTHYFSNDRLGMQKVLQNIVDKIIITAVRQGVRNQHQHIVSVFMKDLATPLTMLIETKPRGLPEKDWLDGLPYATTGHGRCIFFTADKHTNWLIQYNERNQLVDPKPYLYEGEPIIYRTNPTTAIDKVVDLILKFHPELYSSDDVSVEEWENYQQDIDVISYNLPVNLIQMEEVNLKVVKPQQTEFAT